MRKIAFLFLLLISLKSFTQEDALEIGEVLTISSAILQEERTLNVYLPHDYDETKNYPVIYLLDGSIHEDFLHIVGLVQFFNLQEKMPATIIVGIANVDRKRDFTFYTEKEDFQKEFPSAGHSEKFIEFITLELQPLIERKYKTNDEKYLIGQSLGALLATEILVKRPNLFSTYFIVSPSLWWDDQSLFSEVANFSEKNIDQKIKVFISVGAKEHEVMQKDAEQLYKKLVEENHPNVSIDFSKMEKENHATILHQSIYESLMKLFPLQ